MAAGSQPARHRRQPLAALVVLCGEKRPPAGAPRAQVIENSAISPGNPAKLPAGINGPTGYNASWADETMHFLRAGVFVGLIGCASGQPRPPSKQPNQETRTFAVDLVRVTAECLADNPPLKPGKVLIAAEFAAPGRPARTFDAGSTGGNQASSECAVARATQQLRSPAGAPSKYMRILLLVPGGPEEVVISFPDVLP